MTDDIITKLNVSEAMSGRSALLEGGYDRKPNLQKLSARGVKGQKIQKDKSKLLVLIAQKL